MSYLKDEVRRQRASLAAIVVALAWVVADVPPLVLVAAVVPSALFAIVIRSAFAPHACSRTIVASVLLGALVAAYPAAHSNQFLTDTLAMRTSGPTMVAPTVEEIFKLVAVALAARWFPGGPSLILRGALVGLGFTLLENTQYLLFAILQGGGQRLLLAVYVRGLVGGLHHAVFTATAAAGMSLSSPAARLTIVLWAIAQHMAWNAAVAPWLSDVLCGASSGACRSTPAAFDLAVAAPAITVLALAPGIATVLGVAIRRRHRTAYESR